MEQINVKRWVFHLNILPPRSLLMLTSLMSFPKHQTTLRNAPPSEETTRQRQPSHLSGTTRSLWGRNFSQKAAGICLIGRAARHKHQLPHHTPPPPLLCPWSLSCVQIGLNIVVPLCRAVGTRLANMSRVCKGLKERNVWKWCHQYETTVKLQKEKVVCDAKVLTAREFSYLFSAESRQREKRWDRLPKIQSGGWDCEVAAR